MKVTATQRGFFKHLREPGMEFEIPDEPVRKITGNDDKITEGIAVKGKVPELFASSWMRPGWDSERPHVPAAEKSNAKADTEEI
jgi:hypothetical protein